MNFDGFRDLVRRAQDGDRQAMDQVLAVVTPHLERAAHGCLQSAAADESARDLMQEAWLRAWQNLRQFLGGSDDEQTGKMFCTWLGEVVRTVWLNRQRAGHARKRQPDQAVLRLDAAAPGDSTAPGAAQPAAPDPTPSKNVLAKERVRLLAEALRDLAPPDRQIVQMHFFEDLTWEQIGERLGLTREQVKYRYQLTLRRLQVVLKGLR
jgi:RNA polymerase sigma factor (sigma-70 family)